MRRSLVLALLCLFLTACTGQDRDCLAKVGKKLFDQIEDTAGTSPDPLASSIQAVRGSFSDSNLDSRVVLRLRWERDLEGAAIRVRALAPTTVQLEGFLKDESQRSKAIEVARATRGVETVEDKMKIREKPKDGQPE